VAFDTQYIHDAVDGLSPVFELGPGVGRTLHAYRRGQEIMTLDLSRTYEDRLARNAGRFGLSVARHYLEDPRASYPFETGFFAIGVASQVLLHVPPSLIEHTLSELMRVSRKLVVISLFCHGQPVSGRWGNHVFNHDYPELFSRFDWELNNVVTNEGRICFTAKPLV
jgi:hypothetical protein